VATLVDELGAIVGDAHALTDPDVTAAYAVDWTGRWRGSTRIVVRPGSSQEVAAVVGACATAGAAIVPQGGNTGLVGGAVPDGGAVVVSMNRLDGIADTDADGGQLTAGAGVTISALHAAAASVGWAYGVDWGARDSATVGGSVATNAGGIRVLRHGDTRAQLLGVEAVLADGTVVSHLGGLLKDNTGYHLPSLLCGSEGTLAVVTAARLRLVPHHDQRVTALVGVSSIAEAIALAAHLRREVGDLDAVEFLTRECQVLVGAPLPLPGEHAVYVLVECAGHDDPTTALAAVVGDRPVAVAGPSEPARRADLWHHREAITEAVNRIGPPVKLDVTLPAGRLAAFCDAVPSAVPRDAQVWLFGHVADGNVHVNVTGVDPEDETVDDAVLRLVAEHGGSISAEHGIGRAKRRWLHLARSDAEVAAFRRIKAALDPDGLLNPGVLLPDP
jgi:FAD/FMN-containing dehydrogenase